MRRALLVALVLIAVAACGGGGGGTPAIPLPGHGGTTPAQSTKEPIRVTFPSATGGSSSRRPAFLTPNTASFSLVLYTVDGATPSPQPTPLAIQLTNTQYCTTSDGSTVCNVAFNVPVATQIVVEIQTFDANGNLIGGGFVGPIDTTQATIPSQKVTIGGVLASMTFGAAALSAGDDGAKHGVTFTVTGEDKDGNTILPPGNYPFPVTFAITGDPHASLSVSPASVTSPGPNGSSTVTLNYNSANALTGVATVTGSSGSASANLTFAPILFTPTSLPSLLVGGSSTSVTVSEPGYAGAFTPTGTSSVATVTCAPANCTPTSAGASVTLTVAPGTTSGAESVSIADTHGFATLPITVTSTTGGPPLVGAPVINEYMTAASGTNYGITVGPDGSSLWFVDRANSTIAVVPNPSSCSGTTCVNTEIPNPQSTTAPMLQAITSGSDGNLYYTSAYFPGPPSADNGAIFQVTCTSVPASCVTPGNSYTSDATGFNDVIAAHDGVLYASDGNSTAADGYILNATNATCCSFSSDGSIVGGVPNMLAMEPTGNFMWFTDTKTALIGYFPIPCGGSCSGFERPGASGFGGGLRHRNAQPIPRGRDCACVPPPFLAPLNGIVGGPDGNMYMAEAGRNRIDQLSPSNWTNCVSTCSYGFNTITLPQATAVPQNLTVGPDGNIWFTDTTGYVGFISIPSCATACKAYEFHVGGAPWGITKGPDGNIWFTDSSTNKIGEVVLQ